MVSWTVKGKQSLKLPVVIYFQNLASKNIKIFSRVYLLQMLLSWESARLEDNPLVEDTRKTGARDKDYQHPATKLIKIINGKGIRFNTSRAMKRRIE